MSIRHKKSVRFGEAIEILDYCARQCNDPNNKDTSTPSSAVTTTASRGSVQLTSWMETLITKRPSWPKSTSASRTWYTADEMNDQFRSDLEDLQIWKIGCTRGMELHMEENASRRAYVNVFIRAVVQKSRDLKQQQLLQQQQELDESSSPSSIRTSNSSSSSSRKSINKKKIDSKYIESYLGRYSAKHSKESKKVAIYMGREDEATAYCIHHSTNETEEDDDSGMRAHTTTTTTNGQGGDERLYLKSIFGLMGKNCNNFCLLRSPKTSSSSSKRNGVVAMSA